MDVSTKTCLNYIIESEFDDFAHEPSKEHVFYHAMVALFGEKSANDDLIEALETKKDEER